MKITQVLTLLAAIGGPAGLIALIMVLPQIRKLQADTTKVVRDAENADIDGASVLSTAALSQMTAAVERAQRAEAHADRLETAISVMRKRLDVVEHQFNGYKQLAQDHVAWDWRRIQELVALGVPEGDIDPAPPLMPHTGGRV